MTTPAHEQTSSTSTQLDAAARRTGVADEVRVVVVGVDGSAASDQALLFAVREAQLRDATLQIVAAYDYGALTNSYAGSFDMGFALGPVQEGLHAAAQALAKASAATVADLAGPPVRTQAVVQAGRPSQVLIDAAKDAALLVVGARGAGAFTRLMLGSTSNEVVHHAHVPVMVVPDHQDHD